MRNTRKIVSLVLVIVFALSLLPVAPVAARQCVYRIYFTQIPRYGTFQDLTGYVRCVDPTAYKVVTYLAVDDPNDWGDGWWVKPYTFLRWTNIEDNSTFRIDVTTGGIDQFATQYALFVVRMDYYPPIDLADPLPIRDLCDVSILARLIKRTPRGRPTVSPLCPPYDPLPSGAHR